MMIITMTDEDEIVTPLEACVAIASMAHLAQTDKQGRPYILHLIRVMMQGQNDDEMMVGVLHDILEDTEMSVGELLEEGIPEHVVEAVIAITHKHWENEPATEYFARIRQNDLATIVKGYDINDNTAPWRQDGLDEATRVRLEKKYIRHRKLLAGEEA